MGYDSNTLNPLQKVIQLENRQQNQPIYLTFLNNEITIHKECCWATKNRLSRLSY